MSPALIASRAASLMNGRADRAVLRADRDADPLRRRSLVVARELVPTAWMTAPAYGSIVSSSMRSLRSAVLDAGLAQVVEDRLREVGRSARRRPPARLGLRSDRIGLAGERERPVRRQALDGEWSGDPDLLLVLVRLVVQQLEVGVAPDRLVDLLAGHALDDVGVVGDRLQRDVLHPLVDEPVPDVVVGWASAERHAGELRLLRAGPRASRRAGSRGTGAHESLPGQGEGDAGGVDRDPATAPLLGDVGGGAGAARRDRARGRRGRWSSAGTAERPS